MTRKCGSLSRKAGLNRGDFDPREVAKGIQVELEHTCDVKRAERIALDHLTEDKLYYKKLAKMEMHRNPGRPRVIESEDIAKDIVKRFNDRSVEYKKNLKFTWPNEMQLVGDSLAVAYASDKWNPKDAKGKRLKELYKHLAESRNRILMQPGFLVGEDGSPWPTIGPMVSFSEAPMPDSVAILGLFEEINLKLHVAGTDESPKFGSSRDDGIVSVKVRHGYLGGGVIRWSVDNPKEEDQPFLFVYTNDCKDVLMVIIGDELSIEKDGVAG